MKLLIFALVVCVWACLMPDAKTPQSNAEHDFIEWSLHCQPGSIDHGTTTYPDGQRAFIVGCKPKAGE